MATKRNTSNLTDSDRWTLYKLILPVAVKNLEDEVAKPEEDLLIHPWAKYFRYTDLLELVISPAIQKRLSWHMKRTDADRVGLCEKAGL